MTNAPYDALALDLAPIPKIFAENKNLVLKRLDDLDQKFSFINQKCNWNKCSTDLSFWKDVQQKLWSEVPDLPHKVAVSHKSAKDDRVPCMLLFAKKLRLWWRGVSKRIHDIDDDV